MFLISSIIFFDRIYRISVQALENPEPPQLAFKRLRGN
jgi:hypothetical protein